MKALAGFCKATNLSNGDKAPQLFDGYSARATIICIHKLNLLIVCLIQFELIIKLWQSRSINIDPKRFM